MEDDGRRSGREPSQTQGTEQGSWRRRAHAAWLQLTVAVVGAEHGRTAAKPSRGRSSQRLSPRVYIVAQGGRGALAARGGRIVRLDAIRLRRSAGPTRGW